MPTRKRLSQTESRAFALEAARALLLESGPQSVTLKAVAGRVGRTHANLLHHFGSALGLQKALAKQLAGTISQTIAAAVIANRKGEGTPRQVVDLVFDAFGREGAGALASWMMLTGNEDALDPVMEALHDVVNELSEGAVGSMRETTLALVLMALGDSQMGGPMAQAIELPRTAARDIAEQILIEYMQRK